MSKNIIVIGSCNTDMVIKADRLPVPGETIIGGSFMMNPGGKGANQAVAAARLKGNVNTQVLLPKGALTHHPINRAVVSPTGLVRSAEGYPLLQATSKGGAR